MGLSRRNERIWIGAWLGCCALAIAAVAWGVGLSGADKFVEQLDNHWIDRLDAAEALVEAGQNEQALFYLEALEPHFPAKFIRHKFDRERERLYALLGQAQADLGRKTDALNTFRELAEYDALNWRNRQLLARAYASFGELELAHGAFEQLLALHPNHLPTVTQLVLADADAGDCAAAIERYEHYLDAFLLAELALEGQELELPLQLSADGRAHRFELPISVPADLPTLDLTLNGWSLAISPLTFSGPLHVGAAAPRAQVTLTPSWSGAFTEPPTPQVAAWSTSAVEARLSADLTGQRLPAPSSLLSFELTIYKAVGPELWEQVERCYQSLDDPERYERARARTVVGGCLEAGTLLEE